jgi:AcrR family transcriptional regulator
VLAAALRLFSRKGFDRVTTDQIARESGVSQAYAVRAFGGKTGLIRFLCQNAAAHVEALFRVMAPAPSSPASRQEFREQFQTFAFESDEMRLLAQLFACGADPELGPLARDGFLRVSRLLHDDLGMSLSETRRILATGMLAATLAALDYPQPADSVIQYLIDGSE